MNRFHVQYLRPDGWWELCDFATESEARLQVEKQLDEYPGASYRVALEEGLNYDTCP